MTRIERIKIGLKLLRATTQFGICYGLCKICIKLNGNAKPKALCRGMIGGIEDILDASKALDENELYEEWKRIYNEL